jgi:hypothetical protein
MLSLDSRLRVPAHVVFSKVADASVLLNTKTRKYYALDEVGVSFWDALNGGVGFRKAYEMILGDYDVTPTQLESDLLELVQHLTDAGLVELDKE